MRNLHFEVDKVALRGSQSAMPATKSALRGSQGTIPATNSANEPHVLKSRFITCRKISARRRSPPCPKCRACHEICTSKLTAPIPCTCHEKSTLTKTRGFPCTCHDESDHHVRKRIWHHNESAVARSTRRGPPDFVSLRSRNALRGFQEP